jgi:hypothetical protein
MKKINIYTKAKIGNMYHLINNDLIDASLVAMELEEKVYI